MAQDEKRLPEGTDKVIAGASGGGEKNVTADTTLVKEKKVAAPKGPADRSSQGTIGAGEGVMEKIRSGRDKAAGQAADKARDFVGQGIERSSEALGNVGRLVSETAAGMDERLGPEYGDYARRAGTAIEDAARRLAAKDPDELIEDTRSFVRKSPGVALAGAAIVGFALARLVKSGLDSNRRDDEA